MKTKTNYRTQKNILGSFLISIFVLSPFGNMVAFADETSSLISTGTTGTVGGQRIIIDTLAPDPEPEKIETQSGPINTGSENENVAPEESVNNSSSMTGGVVGGSGGSSSSGFRDNPYVIIQATKVVCRNPQDLPRGHDGPDITRTTATDFVATHPNCWLGGSWDFQWGFGEKDNPVIGPGGVHRIPGNFTGEANGSFGEGTNTGTGYNDWKTFGSTNQRGVARVEIANLEHAAKIWVREVQKPGYIPFVDEPLQDNRPSAQMWCHDDVLTYDNFDFIRDPEIGNTYYCVAFNAIDPSVASPTVTLTANPTEIQPGGSSTLTWATENATSCSSSEFDTNGAASGSTLVTPQIVSGQSFTYNIYCSNPFELAGTASVTITAASPGGGGGGGTATTTSPTATLTANPTEIQAGGSSTLTWTSQNAVSCSSSEFNTANATSGSIVVNPEISAGQSKTYSIVCLNSTGVSTTAEATISATSAGGGGGGSSGGGGGGSRNKKSSSVKHAGEILGAEATNETAKSCSYIRDFMRMDWKNDPIEVVKLQSFLKTFENLDVNINGIFDQKTFAAVGTFQKKYETEILSPWGYTEATNFVYITTRKKINEIYCNTTIPLTSADISEIDNFRNYFLQAKSRTESIGKNTLPPTPSVSEKKTMDVFTPNSSGEILPPNSSVPTSSTLEIINDNSIGHPPNNRVWNFIKRLFQSKETQP